MQFLNDVPKIAKHHANNASHTPNSGPSAMTMPFKLNIGTTMSLFLNNSWFCSFETSIPCSSHCQSESTFRSNSNKYQTGSSIHLCICHLRPAHPLKHCQNQNLPKLLLFKIKRSIDQYKCQKAFCICIKIFVQNHLETIVLCLPHHSSLNDKMIDLLVKLGIVIMMLIGDGGTQWQRLGQISCWNRIKQKCKKLNLRRCAPAKQFLCQREVSDRHCWSVPDKQAVQLGQNIRMKELLLDVHNKHHCGWEYLLIFLGQLQIGLWSKNDGTLGKVRTKE